MSFDRFKVAFHLTPRGWVEGSHWFYDQKQRYVKPPKDRVETWVQESVRYSEWQHEDTVTWKRIWVSKSVTRSKLLALYAKFPRPE
jgi:hypothetical protein